MQSSDLRTRELFERWLNQELKPEEQEELWLHLQAKDTDKSLYPLLENAWNELNNAAVYPLAEKDRMVNNILRQSPPDTAQTSAMFGRNVYWWAAAAVVLITISTITWRWTGRSKTPVSAAAPAYDIAPGKAGAILTLADGSTIVLDSLNAGWAITQNGSELLLENGLLAYQTSKSAAGTAVGFNKMSTPRGRQFQLILPDGTRVWLNAASSIRYPTAFVNGERRVTVEGEAYFEVVKDAAKPFFVTVNDSTEVQVLGTHFNVNAYSDEATIRTTLLEGSVKVAGASGYGFLKPGQQATVTKQSLKVHSVDAQQQIAWKDGVFDFGHVNNLQEVMRQLARWYDVEIVYEKNVPNVEIWGKMQRNLTLKQLLKVLKGMDLNCRLEEGRRLIIQP